MNTKVIDLIFEHKANILDKNACVCHVANLIDSNSKLDGYNDYILSEVEENYIEFEKHEKHEKLMQLALDFFNREMSDGQNKRLLDVQRADKVLGWRASTKFESGLNQTINWYLNNRGKL